MKFIGLLLLSLMMTSCSSKPTVYTQPHGVSCYQNKDQYDSNEYTCLRIPSYRDPVKWHRVNAWDVMPKTPSLP